MSRPLDALTEAQINAFQHKWYTTGRRVGTEDVARLLRTRAGEMFAAGKDETARMYRAMADEIDQRARAVGDEAARATAEYDEAMGNE